jgi:hypothetical protein
VGYQSPRLISGVETHAETQINGRTVEELYRMLMDPARSREWVDSIEAMATFCGTVTQASRYTSYRDDSGGYGWPRNIKTLPKPGDAICFLKGSA